MLQRLDELRTTGSNFAFETTLSGLWLRRTIASLHASGYATRLVYVWVPDPDVSVARVRTRVLMGGHDVPEEDVRRRYYRSLRNFERVYRGMVTSWWVYDARRPVAAEAPLLIAHGSGDTSWEIHDRDAWERIQAQAALRNEGET
jgi:predicted ABC-type ATPase